MSDGIDDYERRVKAAEERAAGLERERDEWRNKFDARAALEKGTANDLYTITDALNAVRKVIGLGATYSADELPKTGERVSAAVDALRKRLEEVERERDEALRSRDYARQNACRQLEDVHAILDVIEPVVARSALTPYGRLNLFRERVAEQRERDRQRVEYWRRGFIDCFRALGWDKHIDYEHFNPSDVITLAQGVVFARAKAVEKLAAVTKDRDEARAKWLERDRELIEANFRADSASALAAALTKKLEKCHTALRKSAARAWNERRIARRAMEERDAVMALAASAQAVVERMREALLGLGGMVCSLCSRPFVVGGCVGGRCALIQAALSLSPSPAHGRALLECVAALKAEIRACTTPGCCFGYYCPRCLERSERVAAVDRAALAQLQPARHPLDAAIDARLDELRQQPAQSHGVCTPAPWPSGVGTCPHCSAGENCDCSEAKARNMSPDRVVHCWTDGPQIVNEAGTDFISHTCMLPHGHEGPHEWTRDDQIGVRFVAPARDREGKASA
jgi:hypothetical protein